MAKPVTKVDGRVYDHFKSVKQGIGGLENAINRINKQLNTPVKSRALTDAQKSALKNLRDKTQKQIDRVKSIIEDAEKEIGNMVEDSVK